MVIESSGKPRGLSTLTRQEALTLRFISVCIWFEAINCCSFLSLVYIILRLSNNTVCSETFQKELNHGQLSPGITRNNSL